MEAEERCSRIEAEVREEMSNMMEEQLMAAEKLYRNSGMIIVRKRILFYIFFLTVLR